MALRGWLLPACLVAGLSPGHSLCADDASDPVNLQQELDRAAELNITAPWQESQVILDELEPFLDQATPDQFATHQLLHIRNLALAGDMESGLELTDELLSQQAIPDYQRLNALLRGANLAMLARQHERAFAYLNEALDLEPEVDHPDLPTDVFSLAAQMLANVGEFERSIEYGQLSVRRASERGNVRAECVARQRLASAYKDSEKLVSARNEYGAAMKSCQEAGDPVFIGIIEYGLGDILRRLGEHDEAEPLLYSALARHEENQYIPGVAETRLGLAELHFERGDHEHAEELLSELIEHFERSQNWSMLADAHLVLAEIARQRDDPALALTHLEEHLHAREQFLGRERALGLAYLEVEFDTQFREQELALLREQARVRELETQTRLQQERLQQLGYIVTGFLVVILILLLIHATRERRHYQSLSRRDGLTRLNNHTRFFEVTEPAFHEAQSDRKPFTLILADIDHFKKINDQHGHLIGDDVLRRVAARIREVFDPLGITGRIGGEEFAIALPGLASKDAIEPLERLREILESLRADDTEVPVSLSFGIAQARDEDQFNELRKRADEALYLAKHSGRDRYQLAEAIA
jgi:diguanylate cyclase (GGDEF)-like protein